MAGNVNVAPMTYTNVSTDTTIMTTAGVLYGFAIMPATTGAVTLSIYDAKATATGTLVLGGSMASTAGIGMNNPVIIPQGVAMRTGIHVDVSCTTAADSVVIFYGPAKR